MEGERERSEQSPAVPDLQHDIVFDIFSRLPVKPLVQFQSVSKTSLSLIQNPLFIKTHLTKTLKTPQNRIFIYYESSDLTQQIFSIFNYDRESKTLIEDTQIKFPFQSNYGYLRIVGSINGLICFFDTNYFSYLGILFLWNPILRKFKVVPDSCLAYRITDTFFHIIVGFGFVSEISDFKIVQILYNLDSNSQVLVYTLGNNCWVKINVIVPCYIPKTWSESVFVNGSVHWMASERPNSFDIIDRIMLFDMRNEVFGDFALPKNIGPNYNKLKLSAYSHEDTLCLFSLCDHHTWQVWLMKEYGVVESWVKQYTIDENFLIYPLRYMDNGDIFGVLKNGNLVFFDAKKPEFEETEISGRTSSFCVVDYTEGLGLIDKGNRVRKI